MGKFIVIKRKEEFQFYLKSVNGIVILTSEYHNSKHCCMNAIEAAKENARMDENYIRKTSSNGQYYFVLKSVNGDVIGTSEMYMTTWGRENAIASIKYNTQYSRIKDETGVSD